MSKKWYEQRDLLNLRHEWYDKLKEEGFEDIENICWANGESYECLDGISAGDLVKNYSHGQRRYYQLASQYLWELRKEAARERRRKRPRRKRWKMRLRVWKLHAEGLSVREIALRLNTYRTGVHRIVLQHRADMLEAYREELQHLDLPGIDEDL